MRNLEQALGRRIQELRTASGLTQQQLADRAGIDVKYEADLEHGRRSPSLDVLWRLIKALQVQPATLFTFSLEGKMLSRDREAETVVALLRQAAPADKRLIVELIRTVVRSRRSSKRS